MVAIFISTSCSGCCFGQLRWVNFSYWSRLPAHFFTWIVSSLGPDSWDWRLHPDLASTWRRLTCAWKYVIRQIENARAQTALATSPENHKSCVVYYRITRNSVRFQFPNWWIRSRHCRELSNQTLLSRKLIETILHVSSSSSDECNINYRSYNSFIATTTSSSTLPSIKMI